MLGICELATSLEDPFSGHQMPLEEIARSTVKDVAKARREAWALLGLGVGGEGEEGEGDGGGKRNSGDRTARERKVFETVDWKAAEEAFSCP
jgi:hypothetical protein